MWSATMYIILLTLVVINLFKSTHPCRVRHNRQSSIGFFYYIKCAFLCQFFTSFHILLCVFSLSRWDNLSYLALSQLHPVLHFSTPVIQVLIPYVFCRMVFLLPRLRQKLLCNMDISPPVSHHHKRTEHAHFFVT